MIIVVADHCGCGYNCRIELIILAQEPCLNSSALLRYGQKSRINFCRVVPFLLQNFLPNPDEKNVNILGANIYQRPLDS